MRCPYMESEPTYERLRDAAVAGVRWIAVAKVVGEGSQLSPRCSSPG